jgi:hypothetical protein
MFTLLRRESETFYFSRLHFISMVRHSRYGLFPKPGDDWLGHYAIAARRVESIAWLYVLNCWPDLGPILVESDCLAVFHGRDLQADSGQDDQSAYSGPLQFLGTGLGCTAQQQGVSSWHQQSALLSSSSSAGRDCTVLIPTHHSHVIKLWTRAELTVS